MQKLLSIISLSVTFLCCYFIVPAYGQISWCGGMSWGLPLERSLTLTDRFNPPHFGADYRAADGDNVFTVADGKISKIDSKVKQLDKPDSRSGLMIKGWGRYVVVDHPDGSQTLYAHLQEGSTNHLYEGMPVNKGDTIGKADSTGGVTGPHLHLEYSPTGEIYDKNSKQDPLPCLCNVEGLPALTLSGPDAPTDGSQYTASGGTEPYTWSITKGSITQTGVVTVSGQCGTATVTVKDNCGNQATKDVRMPSGRWVDYGTIYTPCGVTSGSGWSDCTTIVGDTKKVFRIGDWTSYCEGNEASVATCFTTECGTTYVEGPYNAGTACWGYGTDKFYAVRHFVWYTTTYKWSCP